LSNESANSFDDEHSNLIPTLSAAAIKTSKLLCGGVG